MATILYNIFISPLELVLEILFELIFRIFRCQPKYIGFAIIGVSIAVSMLSLPLYRRADILQKKAREKQKQMEKWISHIRRAFKGNERFMILQYYYKLNKYSPFSALECAIPLLLQIPFFTAAYHFLSHLELLKSASFWIFKDLGAPDSLFSIGGFSINILPVLMTAFNCISALLYLKGFAFKDKLQTYGMAAIFLVLLYKSPAGLVLYWTCNNIFSLVKNIFYKLKHPKETAYILCAAIGTILTLSAVASGILDSRKKYFAVLIFQYISLLPLFLYLSKDRIAKTRKKVVPYLNISDVASFSFKVFLLSGLFLSLLLGVLIPSSVIASSPAEFINFTEYRNPFLFLIYSTCYAIGFCLVWMGIVRHMLPENAKQVLSLLLWVISGICLLNYLCFGRNLGILSPLLVFETGVHFSKNAMIINFAALLGLSIVLIVLFRFKRTVLLLYIVLILCISSISVYQIYKGQNILKEMAYIKDVPRNTKIEPIIHLSRHGKNVIVFMLDRAISGYVPYLLEEKPILRKQFAGFTYYPNTLSFGFFTNFGAPPIFGGYEYTPMEMNKRSTELLADKHNESLKMLPVLFGQNGYTVTVCDPPYAGYNWIPDLSIFDDCPNTKAYILSGIIKDENLETNMKEKPLYKNERNFFCYSIFKALPLVVSTVFYDHGDYLSKDKNISENLSFLFSNYSVLTLLPNLTKISNSKGTFLSIQNATPHSPEILQLPDYTLKENINNTGYKTAADGHIKMDNKLQIAHYHVNMATFLQLGRWFDFMRENGVYDNTRIILVADHGRDLGQFDYMLIKQPWVDVQICNPLLMVKDFGAKDFKISNDFMTNADVPILATNDIFNNPINPFTKKIISNKEKTQHPQIITTANKWDITKNNGTTFDTGNLPYLSVHDDIFNPDNWEKVEP